MEQDAQKPLPAKKSDDKVTKILLGVVFVIVMVALFVIAEILPFCKETCKEGLTILEVAAAPVILCVAVLVAGVLYNKMKKLPEKRAEIPSSEEVPLPMLMRLLMTSYTISILICMIPSAFYVSNMIEKCGGAEYKSCGTEVNIPYFAFFFPVSVAIAVFAAYKLTYLLWVPLFEDGRYPNGNPIMRHATPRKVKFMTLGAAVAAAIMALVLSIVATNIFK